MTERSRYTYKAKWLYIKHSPSANKVDDFVKAIRAKFPDAQPPVTIDRCLADLLDHAINGQSREEILTILGDAQTARAKRNAADRAAREKRRKLKEIEEMKARLRKLEAEVK